MAEKEQPLLFPADEEWTAKWAAHEAEVHAEAQYEEQRKAAWYANTPFPEDEAKWFAWANDYPRGKSRELVNAAHRAWYRLNSEWRKHATHSLRAQKLGRKVGRREPILRVYARVRSTELITCYWCKIPTRSESEREVDHKIPLSRGGDHKASNLCIACRECNRAKKALMPAEFAPIIAVKRRANLAQARNAARGQLTLGFEEPSLPKRKEPRMATGRSSFQLGEQVG